MRLVLSTATMSKRLEDMSKLQDLRISTWKDSINVRAKEIQSCKSKIFNLQKVLNNQETILPITSATSGTHSSVPNQACCVSPTSDLV